MFTAQLMVLPGIIVLALGEMNRTAGPNCPAWAMSYCYSGVSVMEHVCLAVILESGEATAPAVAGILVLPGTLPKQGMRYL